MKSESTQVSIIIPSYKGAKKLPNILQALEQQTFKAFEVIIIMDGAVDNSRNIINSISHPYRMQIIDQPNKGRAATRNAGLRIANGDLLIFFDDDTRPVPGCVALHVNHYALHSDSIMVGNVPEEYKKMQTDFQHYKAYLSREWVKHLNSDSKPIDPDRPFITAANFSIPKNLFIQLSGFDEKLTDAEDFDLAVRATQMQIPIYFNSDAIAWHDDFISCRSCINRQRQYTTSYSKLKSAKPDLYQKFDLYSYKSIGRFKKMIYRLFSNKLWVDMIDNFNCFLMLPKKYRYKLYSVIVTGLSVYFPDKPL